MRRALAYANDVAARRRGGERIGLLVVAVGDWEAGLWYDGRPAVARVVLPEDLSVAAADWSVVMALDVVVCGRCAEPLFYAVCAALERAGAASIWGEFEDGIWLLVRARKLWFATDGPFSIARFGAALRAHRGAAMALSIGFYGSRIFDAARAAIAKTINEVPA